MESEDLDIHFQFGPIGDSYIELPDEITERMYSVVRAVARGHGGDPALLVEAQHLKTEVDMLAAGELRSGHEV